MNNTANEQLIIIYEDSMDHRIRKYTTAYSKDQGNEYLIKCVEKVGRQANTRVVPARQLSA